MNIRITGEGNINSYYVQTLCLIYFPGEGFKENENSRWCKVHVSKNPDASVSFVELGDSSSGVCYTGRGRCYLSTLISDDHDKADKIAVGIAFREAAEKFTEYDSPWGILTGVRPARVASAIISQVLLPLKPRIISEISTRYPQKAKLATDVSIAEKNVLTSDPRGECSIYVAIPFCPSRCRYCSFVSVSSPGLLKLIPEYLPALKKDIKNITDTIKSLGLKVSSVYVGGGTPTILDADMIDDLLSFINESVGYGVREFTFEAGRPDTITKAKLDSIVRNGVSRISVNTQTLNEEILAAVGRKHTANDFFEAYALAKESGVKQINVDLIAGLPGETSDSFLSAVERIIDLRPEDITVHTFTVKRSSEYGLSDLYSRESRDAEISVNTSSQLISAAGYIPYYMYRQKNTVGNLENVGYSLPGCEGMYNIYMMEEVHTVFGAGASSVTRLTLNDKVSGEQIIERVFEPKYPYEYLKDHSGDAGDARRRILREKAREFYNEHC